MSSLSSQSSLPLSAVIMHVWIWTFALFKGYHYMRNNTWCETQGWVLGHAEVSALQPMNNAGLRLQCSLLLAFGTHCSAGKALPLPAKPEWFHRDQCGDLWSCSSWLQQCFWAAGDEPQEVTARTKPHCTSSCYHAGSGQDVPVVSTLHLRMVPRGSCPWVPPTALRNCCQNQEWGFCFSLTSSFSSGPQEDNISRQWKERVWTAV